MMINIFKLVMSWIITKRYVIARQFVLEEFPFQNVFHRKVRSENGYVFLHSRCESTILPLTCSCNALLIKYPKNDPDKVHLIEMTGLDVCRSDRHIRYMLVSLRCPLILNVVSFNIIIDCWVLRLYWRVSAGLDVISDDVKIIEGLER